MGGSGFADLILVNGHMRTMERTSDNNVEGAVASAMAIRDGRIVAIGTENSVLEVMGPNTSKMDLQGRTVLPGFNDSHMHLIHYGFQQDKVCLEGLTSVEEVVRTGKQYVKLHQPAADTWIEGWGWNQNLFDQKLLPTKADLDSISTEHPIIFTRICCHIAVVNSKALALCTAHAAQADQVTHNTHGLSLNTLHDGILRESELDHAYGCMPKPSREKIKQVILKAVDEAVAQGLTSVQTSDLHGLPLNDVVAVYKTLAQQNLLKLRVNLQLYLPKMSEFRAFLAQGSLEQKPLEQRTLESDQSQSDENLFFKLGPLKLLLDGSLGGRTAALRESYADEPGNFGLLTYSKEELDELVSTAHANGMQVSLHAIGDRTIDVALNAIEAALETEKQTVGTVRKDHRHRINHCQISTLEQMERMAELGVMADVQPIFVSSDWKMVTSRVGEERARFSYAWKTIQNKGVKLAGSSDCPIEPFNPLEGIYAAVTRKDLMGWPAEGWHPQEALSVDDAVALFTTGSAYATFEETEKGTLAVGKLADFVVLSDDPWAVKPEAIKNISTMATFVGGRLVYGQV